jgi:hypothetical protein
MKSRDRGFLLSLAAFAMVSGAACAGGTSASLAFQASANDAGLTPAVDAGTNDGGETPFGLSGDDASVSLGSGLYDAAPTSADDAATVVPIVYMHTATTLYKLDTATKTVAVAGAFTGCTNVYDIALDQASNAYVTTETGFYAVNLANAACTYIAEGSFPNSLSFVPKGTLDPNVEALVGYLGAEYVRIDTTTGAITTVGTLTGGYQSSGDIASVIGGGTFLTVNGNGCGDCLLQVDPATGDMIQNYGSVGHVDVFGLAYWGGTAYGFDDTGDVFSINVVGGSVVTADIAPPSTLGELSFWGAGSTTSAPVAGADGGDIPIMPPK